MKQREVSVQSVVTQIYQAQCDGCEEDLEVEPPKEGYKEKTGEVKFNFGYFSDDDGKRGKYIFCQTCSYKIYNKFQEMFPNLEPLVDTYTWIRPEEDTLDE